MRLLATAAASAALLAPIAVSSQAPAIAATLTLVCAVTVDNPHYSSGSNGVIAKVRYSCTGNTTGTLTISAYLESHAPGEYGPYYPDASNTGVQRAVGPGVSGTVYVPKAGLPGIPCRMTYWYDAWASTKLVAAGQTRSGTPSSNTVHPSRCS